MKMNIAKTLFDKVRQKQADDPDANRRVKWVQESENVWRVIWDDVYVRK